MTESKNNIWSSFAEFLIFIIYIVAIYGLLRKQAADNHEELMEELTHRSELDSLYWNHLESCDFVLKPGAKPDKNN